MPHTHDLAAGHGAVLAKHTTLRLGGPAREFVVATSESQLIEAVSGADDAGTPVLVLGGGSNLVVADSGFDGLVVKVAHRGIRLEDSGDRVMVDIAAGEVWDDVVALSLREGLAGLECLSGIPGLAGATPIQNVGAYGAEVSDLVVAVRAFDRVARAEVALDTAACGFGYRTSALKGHDRYLVLGVTFLLAESKKSVPIRYAELANRLGVDLGAVASTSDVREAVLGLRAKKGMLVSPSDPDSVSAGSFFTNPIVASDAVPDGAPCWSMTDGRVKTSAAWLIEHAGFSRGYGVGRVGVSTKHTLALVNRGDASTSELVRLACEIRDGVYEKFGICLEAEPTLIGVRL